MLLKFKKTKKNILNVENRNARYIIESGIISIFMWKWYSLRISCKYIFLIFKTWKTVRSAKIWKNRFISDSDVICVKIISDYNLMQILFLKFKKTQKTVLSVKNRKNQWIFESVRYLFHYLCENNIRSESHTKIFFWGVKKKTERTDFIRFGY